MENVLTFYYLYIIIWLKVERKQPKNKIMEGLKMIKLKEKEVKENYECYSIGYCEAQDLLSLEGANFYTAGVYGWNADIYIFGNTAIVTGYRPFGERLDLDIVNKYNKKAYEYRRATNQGYEVQKRHLQMLIYEMLTEYRRKQKRQKNK